jgi:DNA-binding transcriptional regulator YhcF (GntR family)
MYLLPCNLQDFHRKYSVIRNERLIKAEKSAGSFVANSFNQDVYDAPAIMTELQNDNATQLVKTLIKVEYMNIRKKNLS